MRRKLSIAVIIIVCFLLQSTVFQSLAIASISPNLLVVVTAAFGFMRGQKEGLFVGFFCGLIIDLTFGSVLGFYALVYMFIGFTNGFFKRIFFPDEIRLPIALIALSDFCCNLVIYFIWFWFRNRFSFGYFLLHTIIPELVYTMLAAIVLYFILLKINQKLEEIEKKSETKFG
ncbi:MAG: rod shape-determining protein MreD [Clostridiales bacterium]|nr:rod shape-determining protein MreD [Clostridiales bacterium]MCD8133519.1 rod shape-determining protein MreD [Clostridiales bacterium]